MMKRLILVLLVLGVSLAACQRGGEESGDESFEGLPDGMESESTEAPAAEEDVDEPDVAFEEVTPNAFEEATPNASEEEAPASEPEGAAEPPAEAESPAEEPAEPVEADVAPIEGRFTNLRFTSSSTGLEQSNFPIGTEEIYAIWDYEGMTPEDVMERLWYHNDELYVERREDWNMDSYGASGTVRDIFLYNYVDGIAPGEWRVEIYLNGEQQLVGHYTIGGP